MKTLRHIVALTLCLTFLAQVVLPRTVVPKEKDVRIRGYVTAVHSPTSFEIEDYRITSDSTLQIELENQSPGLSFKAEDLRVGVLIEIRGRFNEETDELKATKIKVDLRQFREIDLTTILERKPTQLEQVEAGKWRGVVLADGRRVRIEPETQVFYKLNKGEQKEADKKAKEIKKDSAMAQTLTKPGQGDSTGSAESAKPENAPAKGDEKSAAKGDDEQETTAAEEAKGAGPLTSLNDLGPGVTMTYQGKEQVDGTVLASKVTFVRNEHEKSENELWKSLSVKEKPGNFLEGKPGELKVGSDKYKILPNKEVQDYVERLGRSLVPEYQKAMSIEDPNKIPFHFVVVVNKEFNAAAYPNGTVVVNSGVFDVLENEAQLAAVIGHEIAHATQEHGYRQLRHNRKKRTAIMIASLFAAGMGYYSVSNVLDLVNMAMVNGYARTMENQADRVGMEYLVDAGYDPRQSPVVWKLVSKKYGDRGVTFWSNHDSNSERRSFQMVTLSTRFRDQDFNSLKTNEGDYKRMAQLAADAAAKRKKITVKV